MASTFSQFDAFKLSTTFHEAEGYCEHILCEPSADSYLKKASRVEKWSRGGALGKGGFGMVWLEKEARGALRAVKQMSKAEVPDTRELLALTQLNAYPEFFVRFIGWFENADNIYLAMEYLQCGDLASFIWGDEIPILESEAKAITVQLLQGLQIMHDNNFCHRDLKPQNILVVSLSPVRVKIGDFGISKQVCPGDNTALRTTAGTSGYIAPEILGFLSSKTSVYTSAVDLWSLGCLIHAILTQETPFPDIRDLLEYIQSRIPFPKEKLSKRGASLAAISFITRLLMPHPDNRMGAEEALSDPWLNLEREKVKQEERKEVDTFGSEFSKELVVVNPAPVGDAITIEVIKAIAEVPKEGTTEIPSEGTINIPTKAATVSLNEGISELSQTSTTIHDCITLYCACKHQNLTAMKRLCLNPRVNANIKQNGETLLHMVAKRGTEEMMRLLMEKGADVHAKDKDSKKALQIAVERGHEGMVALLLERASEYNLHKGGHALLETAFSRGYIHVGKLLLDKKANITGGECPAIVSAVLRGQEEVVQLLLENGADGSTRQASSGEPLLNLAVQRGQEGIVKMLLENGVDLKVTDVSGLRSHQRPKDFTDNTALHMAARDGHEGIVLSLLANGADTRVYNYLGRTPLHLAAEQGHEGVLKCLLESGADITCASVVGGRNTALHLAIKTGNKGVVALLLENGADLMARNGSRSTMLHLAAKVGDIGVLNLLLENGPPDINATDRNLDTALHLAVYEEHNEAVKLLLENGATIKENKILRTPLHIAAEASNNEALKLLLGSEGAKEAITLEALSRATPLHLAVAKGHKETAKLLLGSGPHAWIKNASQKTPLEIAATAGNTDMVKILLGEGPGATGVEFIDKMEALYLAIQGGHEETVKVFLENGVDIWARSGSRGNAAIHVAAEKGNLGVLVVLLEQIKSLEDIRLRQEEHRRSKPPEPTVPKESKKADKETVPAHPLGIKNAAGLTALHVAVASGHQPAVKLLLDHWVDKTATAGTQETALHLAARTRHVDIVETLLQRGADITARDNRGGTPLHTAARVGYSSIVTKLITWGAGTQLKDSSGRTPLREAIRRGNKPAVTTLRQTLGVSSFRVTILRR